MNLTVDQMDVLNFRLTEVSLELLGNNFYDIFGQKCDTLGSLYRSKSGPTNKKLTTESNLVTALKIEDIFNGSAGPTEESGRLGDNIENDSDDIEENIDSSSDSEELNDPGHYKNNAQNRTTELKIAKIINDVEEEYTRLLMCSESTKMKYFITNKHRMETEYEDEYEICNRFHIEENARLMSQSDAFIKLIKYIKCDSRNEFKMGEIAANILKVKDHISDSATSNK